MANNNYTLFEEETINTKNIFNNDVRGVLNDGNGIKKSEMVVQYPGLVFGCGIPISKTNEDMYSIGINLDYVSGSPVYPSSSLKGILRSVFKQREFMMTLLKKYNINMSETEIERLENLIFEDKTQQVIFFNVTFKRNRKQEIDDKLISDYITPQEDIYKNPVPIKMIRIPENIIAHFSYYIKNIKVNEDIEIQSDTILNIFNDIILFNGIGAKTNQGYGKLLIKKEGSE